MPDRKKTLGETCEELRGHLRESKTREKRAREEIEVATKILRQKEEDIQQKDVLISSKSRRIGELERDMASSHNALADMFLCPITNELPVDPVLAADGKIYERAKIEEWLATSDTSPATGEKLKDTVLTAASSVMTGVIDLLVASNAVDRQKVKMLKTKRENENKVKELQSKADVGDYDAMCSLAFAYREGQFGLAKNAKKAENLFRRSAEAGNNLGMSCYGELLVNKGDLIFGVHYLTRTATECDYSAYRIGNAYHYATLGLPKDLHQAKYYLSMVGKCPVKNLDNNTRDMIATELRAIQDEIDGQEVEQEQEEQEVRVEYEEDEVEEEEEEEEEEDEEEEDDDDDEEEEEGAEEGAEVLTTRDKLPEDLPFKFVGTVMKGGVERYVYKIEEEEEEGEEKREGKDEDESDKNGKTKIDDQFEIGRAEHREKMRKEAKENATKSAPPQQLLLN